MFREVRPASPLKRPNPVGLIRTIRPNRSGCSAAATTTNGREAERDDIERALARLQTGRPDALELVAVEVPAVRCVRPIRCANPIQSTSTTRRCSASRDASGASSIPNRPR